ncbi:hypothetical protein NMG60_11032545 [Bertholletia excelsa]
MLTTNPYLVGIDYQVADVHSWLQDEANDVHIMIICGMAGIGKTTFAKFFYNKNYSKFQKSSFLENVGEKLRDSQGLNRLQKQLFSDILNRKEKVHNNFQAISKLQAGLRSKKVLIIFDAVDKEDQLDKILGERNWLLGGSKIIITTTNESLLSGLEAHRVERITPLSSIESLDLFNFHAFGTTHPNSSFNHASQPAADYCQGHPLAIKVLASLLRPHRNHLDIWTDEVSKLKESPNKDIFTVLRKSYDSLEEKEKDLFLHIACLFVGKKMEKVLMTLNSIGFHAKAGISTLVNRCMLEEDDCIQMHQLFQEMGREIVYQESTKELGKCSILWNYDDSFNVLRDKIGTGKIKSIVLDGSQRNHSNGSVGSASLLDRFRIFWRLKGNPATTMGDSDIALETDAFSKMHNLKFLKLKCVQLRGSYENFPRRLRYLKWHKFPLKLIPSNFAMDELVVLNMKYSSLKYLWKGSKNLRSLEILNLKDSHSLRVTPDFSKVPRLKQLILENCTSLVELHESIGKLKDLILLNLKNCKNLTKLPRSIGMLESLETLDVSDCSRLEGLPSELENVKSLHVLYANRIGEANARKRKAYIFKWMLKPQKTPKITLASLPQSLTELNLRGCNLSDEDFPSNLSILGSLKTLNLSYNMISKTPDFIKYLPKLYSLILASCMKLHFVFVGKYNLEVKNCAVLKRITLLYEHPSISEDPCISDVTHQHCEDLSEIKDPDVTDRPWEYLKRTSDLYFKSLFHVYHMNCEALAEIEGCFKLEPIENVDAEILSYLGFCNWETHQSTNVNLYQKWARKAKKYPLQVYYMVGMFYTNGRYFEAGQNFADRAITRLSWEKLSNYVQSDEYPEAVDQKRSYNIFRIWYQEVRFHSGSTII